MIKARVSILRELLLLRRPDAAAARRANAAIAGPGRSRHCAVGERIVVGVNDHPGADRVIRAAKNLADALRAPWTAVTVETPRTERLGNAARARLAATLNLAAELGGTIATVPAASVDQGLRAQITQIRATTLVLGKAPRGWWFELRHGSVVDRLVRGLPEVAIYVVPLAEADSPEALRPMPPQWRGYGLGLMLVALTSLCNLALEPLIGSSALDMIYLVPVIASATLFGLRPALLAAAFAALTYNFFFLPPRYDLAIQRPEDLVEFLVLGGVGIVAAQLAGRVRREANVGARTAADNAAIAAFGQRLSAVADRNGAAQAICQEVVTLFGVKTVVLSLSAQSPGTLAPHTLAAVPAYPGLTAIDLAAADFALTEGKHSGRGSAKLPSAHWEFHPLTGPSGVLAVLGIAPAPADTPFAPDRQVLFASLLGQAAMTLERLELETEARRADVLQQRDDLRATLISALGHDLRTPLTTVVAAAAALAREHGVSPAAESLQASAWRLQRLFNNLVEMTRIESGSLQVRREAVDLTDAVAGAVRDLRGAFIHHRLILSIPPGLPLVEADQRMLHHVLINLLENAAKYAPVGTNITVDARCDRLGLSLTILDEGPGLPPGQEARLFERFHRIEGGDARGGTGLGLAIVKGFAAAMGLDVAARNRPGHRGSRFVLTWPQALVRQEAPAQRTQ